MAHSFNFRIAYADTDAGGIVYHARYLEIAERARMEMLAAIDDPATGIIIKELHIEYIKPMRLNDIITVETRFTGHGAATMDFEHKFIKDGDIYAIIKGVAVSVNKELKPVRISGNWLKYIEE